MQSYETLRHLLDEVYRLVGVEQQSQLAPDVLLYQDANGSHRLVRVVDGIRVSAIQVMYREADGRYKPLVANAYTHPAHRRRGHARYLVSIAQRLFGLLIFSQDRSDDGKQFVASFSGASYANPA